MKKGKPDHLHGILDLLILRTLSDQPMHGWAISRTIQSLSRDVLEVGQGSLYPALYRLEDRGWIESVWGVSESGRRARFYSITRQGSTQLASEEADWKRFFTAVNWVLGAT